MEPTIPVRGHDLPALGLGTMHTPGDDATTLVEVALAEGYRHLDTAEAYGNEEAVGRGLARSSLPREQVWLTTKVFHPRNGTPTDLGAAAVAGLRRLGVAYVDALLVHWPHPDLPLEGMLDALVAARDAGAARTIGVCNLPTVQLQEARELVPDLAIHQVEYHLYLDQRPVLDASRDGGLALMAHCPLARGRVLTDPTVREIAEAHRRSPAQVALAWLLQQEGVTAVPGTSGTDPDHLRDNLAATELRLADDEVARLDDLADGTRLVDPPHAPAWDR